MKIINLIVYVKLINFGIKQHIDVLIYHKRKKEFRDGQLL
jgi:hypothetical protein